jgi:non-ribosomal peptide synthetase component E (peptide arylation enzyme)
VRIELADYKAPDRIQIVDRLPVNAMMKVDKSALRAQASASQAGSGT